MLVTALFKSDHVEIFTDDLGPEDLTPSKVVEMLDRYIVGQTEAKRAVAVALRMRSPALLLPLV